MTKRIVFEKRKNGGWVSDGFNLWINSDRFIEMFHIVIREFHSWPALIVGCHLDETTPLAEFFVIEDKVHAEYRLREVEGND